MPLLLKEDLRHRDAPGLAALGRLLAEGRCEVPAGRHKKSAFTPPPAGKKKPGPLPAPFGG